MINHVEAAVNLLCKLQAIFVVLRVGAIDAVGGGAIRLWMKIVAGTLQCYHTGDTTHVSVRFKGYGS